jgi:hypothetical protein
MYNDISAEGTIIGKLVSTIIMVSIPIAIFLVSYFSSPDYFAPFVKHPLGIAVLVGCAVWLFIGFFVLLITNGWQRKVASFCFIFPVTVIPMLGPAVITIMTALGPVMSSP